MTKPTDEDLAHISPDLRSLAVHIDTLTEDPVNARVHPTRNIDSIRASLTEFGQRKPLVVRRDGMIVEAGNGLLESARAMGWKYIAVSREDDDATTATRYGIVDNRTSDLSHFDGGVLSNLVQAQLDDGLDVESLGFNEEDVQQILAGQWSSDGGGGGGGDPPPVVDPPPPEAPVDPVTVLGGIWICGKHRLICGDSTDKAVVGRVMLGQLAAMVFTDPPYGIKYEGGSRPREELENDDLGFDGTMELIRVSSLAWPLKPGGAFYVCSPAGNLETAFRNGLDRAERRLRQGIAWIKNNATFGRSDYHYQHETILYGWADDAAHTWCGDRKQTTAWEVDRPPKSEEHPTMKPVALVARALVNSTKGGWTVFDGFAGSGTTMLACEQLGRVFRGVELAPKYCDVIARRWAILTGETAYLEVDGERVAEMKP